MSHAVKGLAGVVEVGTIGDERRVDVSDKIQRRSIARAEARGSGSAKSSAARASKTRRGAGTAKSFAARGGREAPQFGAW